MIIIIPIIMKIIIIIQNIILIIIMFKSRPHVSDIFMKSICLHIA